VDEGPSRSSSLERIAAERGYVLDMHKILADADPKFLRQFKDFLEAAYARRRALDRRTKEFVHVGGLASLRSPRSHHVAPVGAALDAGATSAELLEGLEQELPPARVPRSIDTIDAWSAVCVVDGRGGATGQRAKLGGLA
jgi:4-carboxymuconolactone decarboxylase